MEADINGVVRNILRHVKNSEAIFLIKELGRNLKECEEKINDPARIEVDGNEMSIVVYCAEKYGARQAQEKTAIILDYLRNSTDV